MRLPVIPLAALAVGGLLFLIIPFRGPRNTGTSPEVTPAMVEYASHLWPGSTAAQLAQGRALLRERCIECHHRPGPEMAQAAQWPDVLKLMAKRAKLSDEERETILHYLLSAKQTLD
jgi:hypothetical protein